MVKTTSDSTTLRALAFAFAGALLGACGADEPTDGDVTTGGEAPTADYSGAIASTDIALGQHEYEEHCNGCHPGGNEGYGPAVAGIGWDPARMRRQIREGEDQMPAFGEDKISADELEALLAYLVTTSSVVGGDATGVAP